MAAEFTLEGFYDFFERVSLASQGGFRADFELFLEGIGYEFLRIIQDEIIRLQVVDTRLLLNSFHRNDDNNVWRMEEDGLLLEVGSNLDYSVWVNDGHYLNPHGVDTRFVPGYWYKDTFVYDPNADGGMMLRQKWIDGKHYFDTSFRILERLFPKIAEAKLEDWLSKYFA